MTISSDLVIGVDGGGSKTVAWLARAAGDLEDSPLGVGQAGPGNPRAVGFETARQNIAHAVRLAWEAAAITSGSAAGACLGLAGAGRPEEQLPIAAWAQETGLAKQVRVTHDAEIILAAGTRILDGIALICGTGSFAWGRNNAGDCDRSGGWGYLFGDEGSGYAIALAGLRAVAKAADGRGPATILSERMPVAAQVAQPSDLIGRLYRPDISRDWIASLAGVVCDASSEDSVAREIVMNAVVELALLVVSLTGRLALRRGQYDLALAGGVLAHQLPLRTLLHERLKCTEMEPARTILVADPVRGAVALARRLG